uniref:Uncharacterized protein n=1 Tax=Arundo donax TaxID=35708 RepID=A0A0A9CBM2_ARUDO
MVKGRIEKSTISNFRNGWSIYIKMK